MKRERVGITREKAKEKVSEEKTLDTFSQRMEKDLVARLFKEDYDKAIKDGGEGEEEYIIKDTHSKGDGLWDVSSEDEVGYFDPTLSYELTGYRPISMTDGLDFDPDVFRGPAITFDKTGSYTEYPPGGKPYNDYWREQFTRCKEGLTVGKYRVTGDHYFFINFYRMQAINVGGKKAITGRSQSFPSFLAKQYEFFHYVELCEYIGKDVCMLKARGLGFSEMIASLGARPFITNKGYRSMYTAASSGMLEPVLDKCWTQINWLASNTNGGMKRLRQKVDNLRKKRASMVDSEGNEFGSLAEIEGVVADNPRKVRGQRTERLFFEEGGSNPFSILSWIQGTALVELGGAKVGCKFIGGTGGDQGPGLAGLTKIFNNPNSFQVLPYKNYHSRDGKVQYTGFFLPAHEFALNPEYLDKRGVTDSVRFKEYYESKRRTMEGSDLLDYCAEYCFTPDEALLRQGENAFNSAIIADRLTQIRVHKQGVKPEPMALLWDRGDNDKTSMDKVRAQHDPKSKLLVIEPPKLDKDGNVMKNLYVAGIDSIDMGTGDSATDTDVSDFCLVVKKRQFGLEPAKYVAIYKDRPRDIRYAYDMAMKILTWYNSKALLEYTKISIHMYFTEKNKRNLFMQRPKIAMTNMAKGTRVKKDLVGLQAHPTFIKHGLDLIDTYVNDFCYEIDYEEMLEQLLNYSYVMKRKFDIVAAMIMSEIADEDLYGTAATSVSNVSSQWKDFGYYIDDDGIKRFGAIPDKKILYAGHDNTREYYSKVY